MKTSRLVASLTAALAVPACFARQIDSSSAGATADHGSEAGPSGNDGVPSGEPPALDPPAGPNDIVGSLWDGLGNRANGASIRVDGAAVHPLPERGLTGIARAEPVDRVAQRLGGERRHRGQSTGSIGLLKLDGGDLAQTVVPTPREEWGRRSAAVIPGTRSRSPLHQTRAIGFQGGRPPPPPLLTPPPPSCPFPSGPPAIRTMSK